MTRHGGIAPTSTTVARRQATCAIGDHPAGVGEHPRERDDRHHRLGANHRHQHERHQCAGAVARDTPEIDANSATPQPARVGYIDTSENAAITAAQTRRDYAPRPDPLSIFANALPRINRRSEPPHGEFDGAVRQFAPAFDRGHVGGLGEPPEHLARLFACGLPRQRECLTPIGSRRAEFRRGLLCAIRWARSLGRL